MAVQYYMYQKEDNTTSLALSEITSPKFEEIRLADSGFHVGFKAPALGANQIWTLPDADGNNYEILTSDGGGNLFWSIKGHDLEEIRLMDSGFHVGFTAPVLGANQIWTLPNADGNNNDVLTTNGAGVLSWSIKGGGGAATETFKTIDCPAGTDPVADLAADTLQLLVGSAKITITGNEAADSITFDVVEAQIDHDALTNFVADEHIAHSGVSITTGVGLAGGGNITANRELTLSHLGFESLADPGADRILFWDDSETAFKWLTIGAGLSIAAANFTTDDSQIDHDALANFVANEHLLVGAIDHNSLLNYVANEHLLVGAIDHDSLLNYAANQHVVLPGAIANVLSDHDKAAHDALNIDADTVDGEEAAAIVTNARVKAHFPDTIGNILSDHDLAAHTGLGLFDQHADVDHDQTTNYAANEHLLVGAIDHDSLLNYAANQHVVLPGTIANVLSDHDKAAHDALNIDADTVDTFHMDQNVLIASSPTFANEYIDEYIYHTGDVDTYIRFQTDQITLRAGGVDFLNLVEGATDYLQLLDGLNFIGDNANARMTVGLTVNQGANDDEIIALKSSDVNHQITNWAEGLTETDTWFSIRKQGGNEGGVKVMAMADGSVWAAYVVYAFMNANADVSKDGTAIPVIAEEPLKGDPGTHTYTPWNAEANIWGVRTVPDGGGERTVLFVDEDGDLYYDGAAANFQDEDDVELAKELEDILSGRIQVKEMKEKKIFKKYKVVHVKEIQEKDTGKKRLDRYVSTKKMNMLFLGAIKQLGERITTLEATH